MAGDWIKMRKSLPTDPRVVRISSALKADRLRTIGGLMSAWCLLDEQTEDGKLDGYTPEIFDEIVGFPGLAAAMEQVGWMECGDGFLAAPRFHEHNGQSAKRRAQDSVRKVSARKADKCPHEKRTKSGLEKRREECIIPNPLETQIGALLGRRPTTRWSKKEKAALKAIAPIDPEDMAILEKFYSANIAPDLDHRRTSIQTLLNNWNGEIDKARLYSLQNP
jgi:hypothetical protein